MKIGIIVWSVTGHTLLVAERLSQTLINAGHQTTIERIEVTGDPIKRQENYAISHAPKIAQYDALVLCAFVEAFELSPVMKRYIQETAAITEKKVFCLITHHFPLAWLGGTNAAKQMAALVAKKGAIPAGFAVIDWSSKKREAEIAEACDKALGAFRG